MLSILLCVLIIIVTCGISFTQVNTVYGLMFHVAKLENEFLLCSI